MKKVLLATTAAIMAFTGCTQNEEFENESKKAEISFNTAVTRATEMNTSGLQTEGFQVYAYNTGEAVMSAEVALSDTPWINNLATYSTAWTVAGGPYYWPLDDKLQFFAYSPKDGVVYSSPNGTDKGYPKFNYQVGDGAANQKDLVIASVQDATKVTPSVSLNFKHALTQINIKVTKGSSNYEYEMGNVTLTGIKGGGTFTYTGPNTGTWVADDKGTDVTYTYTLGDFVDNVSTVVSGNALMLIPQNIDNAKIVIAYKTKKGTSYVFNGAKEISLPTTTPWEFGKKILYKMTLPVGGEEIKLDAEVGGWNNEVSPDTM